MSCSRWVAFAIVFSFSSLFSQAQGTREVSDYHGADWTSWSMSTRMGYISGFLAGTLLMKNETLSFVSSWKEDKGEWRKRYDEFTLLAKSAFEVALKNADNLSFINIRVGQIVDGVSEFYGDIPNRKIRIIDAIYIVKMQIRGMDSYLIMAQVRYLKMQPIDQKELATLGDKLIANKVAADRDALKRGVLTSEELLKFGVFIDSDGNEHQLFCYGTYQGAAK